MIKFINAYIMADQLEEDVQELKNLLNKGLIKRTDKNNPSFIVLEENLKEVENILDKYKEDEFIRIQTPKEYTESCYCGCGYDMQVNLNFSSIAIDLSDVLDSIKNETEVFTQSEMEKVYNSDNVDKEFRKLLDKITREALKEKILQMSKLVDNVSLWI